MMFTNDLENQIIKVLICLESKAGSETPLCLMMQAIKRKVVKPNKSKQPLHLIQCVSARICVCARMCLCTYVCMCMCVCVCVCTCVVSTTVSAEVQKQASILHDCA